MHKLISEAGRERRSDQIHMLTSQILQVDFYDDGRFNRFKSSQTHLQLPVLEEKRPERGVDPAQAARYISGCCRSGGQRKSQGEQRWRRMERERERERKQNENMEKND